ncbi:hypothetical protein MLD38_010941 [Melastoma candidum]|uniref:Uncharacterized protein n=1 Tax=Melastoma candidum TaxID=119954 RepID=A0ACB9R1I4_9MYRT|nr:hypothetical protein MLD38_010941 [Melastoma candidum]
MFTGLEILAFPCNQFRGQEPGSNEEIQETVCTSKQNSPSSIRWGERLGGKKHDPLYKFLKAEKGGLFIDSIKWNFTKFLVNMDGKVVECYGPMTVPLKIENDEPLVLS